MKTEHVHHPVLLKEAIEGLMIKPTGIYIDGTFGRGGHAAAILAKLKTGQLIAFDKDSIAVEKAKELFSNDERFCIYQGSFTQMSEICKKLNVDGKVDGILLDLGISSPQVDDSSRGFSFLHDGHLDMRMDRSQKETAETWINHVDEKTLAAVFKEYGEERFAKRIANAIVKARTESPIKTTKQLADIISKAHPKWEKHKHPATRCFQAIRIFINQELDDLKECLEQTVELLKKEGRLVVISFHSLEDRIVKQFIKHHEKGADLPKKLPVKHQNIQGKLKSVGRPIKPSDEEINLNPRSRSAILRIAEKIA